MKVAKSNSGERSEGEVNSSDSFSNFVSSIKIVAFKEEALIFNRICIQ